MLNFNVQCLNSNHKNIKQLAVTLEDGTETTQIIKQPYIRQKRGQYGKLENDNRRKFENVN